MKTVCKVLGVARSNITVRARAPVAKPLGRPPQPVADLVEEIKAVIGEMPTYGYRRVWAVLRRAAKAQGLRSSNHKRIYRFMNAQVCHAHDCTAVRLQRALPLRSRCVASSRPVDRSIHW
jgi:HTH-like domain